MLTFRILITGDFIFSSSFDKTAKAWLFDTSDLDGQDQHACIRTFKVRATNEHLDTDAVYPKFRDTARAKGQNRSKTKEPGEKSNIQTSIKMYGQARPRSSSFRWKRRFQFFFSGNVVYFLL